MATKPPVEVPQGAIRLNTDSQKLEFFAQDQWWEMANKVASPIAGRGLMFSGYIAPASTNIIDYVTIASTGQATDFGDTDRNADYGSGYGNETRAVYAGGQGAPSNTISYVTIATQGNATNFGDLNGGNNAFGLGFSGDSTRAVYGGGQIPGTPNTDTIQYITMSSTGNATDFGNLTQGRQSGQAVSSPTRGCYGGGGKTGAPVAQYDVIDYITIQSTGNAVDFGNLANAKRIGNAVCNAVRGVFAGEYDVNAPYPQTDYMQYITIASKGNATDFGDLLNTGWDGSGVMSDSTRGLLVHGYTPSPWGYNNTITYITIATRGNSVDFGDRNSNTSGTAKASNSHGGLG